MRFNAFHDLVSDDRVRNPGFRFDCEREGLPEGKRKRQKDIPQMPTAKHELFSDEESMKRRKGVEWNYCYCWTVCR